MNSLSDQSPLSPALASALTQVLREHGASAEDAAHYLVRLVPIMGLRQLSQQLGRTLTKGERQTAHVRFERGESVAQVLAYLKDAS